MPRRSTFLVSLLLGFFASLAPSRAQMPPAQKDSLIPGQSAQGKAGCSATETSSCAEAAAKILPIVMGSSPMEENLRRLTDEIGGRVTGSPEMAKAVEWGVGAFRAAGVEVHTEKYTLAVTWSEGDTRLELLGAVKFPGGHRQRQRAGLKRTLSMWDTATRTILRRQADSSKARSCWFIAISDQHGPISSTNTCGHLRLSSMP